MSKRFRPSKFVVFMYATLALCAFFCLVAVGYKYYQKKKEIKYIVAEINRGSVKAEIEEQINERRKQREEMGDVYYKEALRYYKGDHVPQDFLKAFSLFGYAAKIGHSMSAYYLANMYQNGQGTPPDKKEAFIWMKKAYEGGVKEATFPLAKMYFYGGLWIPRDYFESSRLLHEAADAGDQEAKKFLRMHSDAFGTLKENN